jgi:tRNA(Arg) A34 adenosine deaminase TadA
MIAKGLPTILAPVLLSVAHAVEWARLGPEQHFAHTGQRIISNIPPVFIPPATRAYWMRRANAVLSGHDAPCPFAPFAAVVVNHTDATSLGELICTGLNSVGNSGNPLTHGETAAIWNCSRVLQGPQFGLDAAETLAAFSNLTLYTNAEPCPMCASAIHWAGFKECVYGTDVKTSTRWVRHRWESRAGSSLCEAKA